MKFNVGNPVWIREDGRKVTYRLDDQFGWRQTTHPDGTVEVHKAPLDAIDAIDAWVPWNSEPPALDEVLWVLVEE